MVKIRLELANQLYAIAKDNAEHVAAAKLKSRMLKSAEDESYKARIVLEELDKDPIREYSECFSAGHLKPEYGGMNEKDTKPAKDKIEKFPVVCIPVGIKGDHLSLLLDMYNKINEIIDVVNKL